MDVEREFWQGENFWRRSFGSMGFWEGLWFWVTLVAMMFAGFYIGFWVSCQREVPLDVPYVTGSAYIENKEQALAAAKNYLGEDGKMTIMLLGCDVRADDIGRSDTLMVAFVDLETPAVDLLSIPRDTYVELANGKGKTKINHAYAYGGVPLTRKTVESFIHVEIDRYVEIDFEGFVGIIDALGGVTIEVERDMYRPSDKINLKKGTQKLNGEDALGYVRWRSDGAGDIGRVVRQQKFLNALTDETFSMGTIFKIPKMMGVIETNVKTDLTPKEMLSLVEIFKGQTENHMETAMVPGVPSTINGISYWIADEVALKELIAKLQEDKPTQTPETTTTP